MAVWSKDENVDPIGACIGSRRARIESVLSQLNGEKIDIIKYSEDPAEFIKAALSPSRVTSVEIISQQPKACRVTVPDEQLSLAIGNKGQNARLAAHLTGYKIDIKSETQAKDAPGFRYEDYLDEEEDYEENGYAENEYAEENPAETEEGGYEE